MIDSSLQPVYPPEAKKAKVSGTVKLDATIGSDGIVKELKVISGPELLQQAALDTVKNWRYRPYLVEGKPTEIRTTINVIFTLAQ